MTIVKPGRGLAATPPSSGPSKHPAASCAQALAELPDADAAAWLVAGWLSEYEAGNTRAAYARDLRDFARWLAGLEIGLLRVDRVVLGAYVDHLSGRLGRRPSTVRRHLGSLSSFYGYAIDAGALASNPAVRVRRPKGDPTLTPALSATEAARLVRAAESAGARDTLLVVLLLGAGLRVSEALALDISDVEQVRGHVTVVVRGKGGREDRITLPASAADAVGSLRDLGVEDGALLQGATGARLTRDGATAALARLSRAAGLAPVRPHALRATAVTLALEAGVPLRDVQDFARHADPRTTRRYDRAARSLDRHAATTTAILSALPPGDDDHPEQATA